LKGTERCPASLVKNGRVEGGRIAGGKNCGSTNGRITQTCRNVSSLFLVCGGEGPTEDCSARITQIDISGK
jgi:hypothetical protein